MENEKDIDKAIKLKKFQVEISNKNMHLNTTWLVKFLNLRIKIKGYVEQYVKKKIITDFSPGTVSAELSETMEYYVVIKKEGSRWREGEGRSFWTNMEQCPRSKAV